MYYWRAHSMPFPSEQIIVVIISKYLCISVCRYVCICHNWSTASDIYPLRSQLLFDNIPSITLNFIHSNVPNSPRHWNPLVSAWLKLNFLAWPLLTLGKYTHIDTHSWALTQFSSSRGRRGLLFIATELYSLLYSQVLAKTPHLKSSHQSGPWYSICHP